MNRTALLLPACLFLPVSSAAFACENRNYDESCVEEHRTIARQLIQLGKEDQESRLRRDAESRLPGEFKKNIHLSRPTELGHVAQPIV